VQLAFQAGLIVDGHIWLEALQDRNLTVLTYEEKIAIAVEEKIRNAYFPALSQLFQDFSKKAEQ
jgi:nucleotidyltransferase substrate binding protein (TIGR01987 family)